MDLLSQVPASGNNLEVSHVPHVPQVANPLDSSVPLAPKCAHFSPSQSLRPLWHESLRIFLTGHPDSLSLPPLHSLPCSQSDFEKCKSDHITSSFKTSLYFWGKSLKLACPQGLTRPGETSSLLQRASSFLPRGLCTFCSLPLLLPQLHWPINYQAYSKQLKCHFLGEIYHLPSCHWPFLTAFITTRIICMIDVLVFISLARLQAP